MLFFPKLNNRNRGKGLTVTLVRSCNGTKSKRMQEPNPIKVFTILCRLLVVEPAAIFAQESDDNRDRDHERAKATST
jgi:hypothetical protein